MLRQLPLAAKLARRYCGRPHVSEQFTEAALVGLVRAIDSFDPTAPEPLAQHAEALIANELDQLLEDCRLARETRILQRDQAAVRATARVEQALLRREDICELAASLGLGTKELVTGVVATIVSRPEVLAAVAGESAAGRGELP